MLEPRFIRLQIKREYKPVKWGYFTIQMTCIFLNRYTDLDLEPLPLSGAYFPDVYNVLDKDLVWLKEYYEIVGEFFTEMHL